MSVERELKLALESEDAYERLSAALPGFEGEFLQVNSYWDVPAGELTGAGVMLRLRRVDRQGSAPEARITVKRQAVRDDEGYFQAPEQEHDIPADLAAAVEAGTVLLVDLDSPIIAELRKEFAGLRELACWGRMANRRRCYRLAPDILLELDRTEFGAQRIDWELEVESEDPARVRALLEPVLARAAVSVTPQTRTKAERLAALLGRDR